MERAQIRERQLEGIALAKAKGLYVGRKPGSVEGRAKFLSKPRIRQISDYLQLGLKGVEIQTLVGCSPNTISKVKGLTLRRVKSPSDGQTSPTRAARTRCSAARNASAWIVIVG